MSPRHLNVFYFHQAIINYIYRETTTKRIRDNISCTGCSTGVQIDRNFGQATEDERKFFFLLIVKWRWSESLRVRLITESFLYVRYLEFKWFKKFKAHIQDHVKMIDYPNILFNIVQKASAGHHIITREPINIIKLTRLYV